VIMTIQRTKQPMKSLLVQSILVATALLTYGQSAHARLSAEAELNYAYLDSKPKHEDNTLNNQHTWGGSFTQKYSILYTKKDKLVNGRLGDYDVALGYELLSFDTKSNLSSGNDTKGHLLYSGNITIDPKEVPIRLTLFSRDNRSGTFEKRGVSYPNSVDLSDYVPAFDLTQRLQVGTHMETGATLVAGVKNSMTNGFNEVLRHFPMILLDYRDRINKDINSDNRLTQLAFVSLNKKDNWFHYRYAIYKDNMPDVDPVTLKSRPNSNNYNETQIQLGTVDQTLQRRWIDFTNWLQVSTDALFVNHDTTTRENRFQDISVNIFANTRRQAWESHFYNTFSRHTETKLDLSSCDQNNANCKEKKIFTYSSVVPVYASGIINPTTSWDATASYNEKHTNDERNFTKFNTGYNLYSFTRSPFTLTHGLTLEYASSQLGAEQSDMLAFSSRVETTSTSRFSKNLSLGASNTNRIYRYNDATGINDFIDNELTGKAVYSFEKNLRLSFHQGLRNTFGKAGSITTSILDANTSTPQYQAPVTVEQTPNSTFETNSALQLDWQPSARIASYIRANENVYVPDVGAPHTKTGLGAGFTYKLQFLTINNEAKYEFSSGEYKSYEFKNSIKYTYSRNMDMFINTIYTQSENNQNSVNLTTGKGLYFEQGLNYYLFKTNGVTRKIFEVNEVFTTGEGVKNYIFDITNKRSNQFSLGLRYYPIRALTLSMGTRQSFLTRIDTADSLYYASAALTYQLFETSLDYSHGRVQNVPNGRIDKRFSVNVKKRF